MKKILVYSHDTYGLGNIRRMLELSAHLVDNDPNVCVLILSGSPMLHAFRIPARIDYVKLPCLSRTVDGLPLRVLRVPMPRPIERPVVLRRDGDDASAWHPHTAAHGR